jgi:hypothetical protein
VMLGSFPKEFVGNVVQAMVLSLKVPADQMKSIALFFKKKP